MAALPELSAGLLADASRPIVNDGLEYLPRRRARASPCCERFRLGLSDSRHHCDTSTNEPTRSELVIHAWQILERECRDLRLQQSGLGKLDDFVDVTAMRPNEKRTRTPGGRSGPPTLGYPLPNPTTTISPPGATTCRASSTLAGKPAQSMTAAQRPPQARGSRLQAFGPDRTQASALAETQGQGPLGERRRR